MEIDISDYLNEEEIKEIAIDTIRSSFKYDLNDQKERILGNSAFSIAQAIFDSMFDENDKKLFTKK